MKNNDTSIANKTVVIYSSKTGFTQKYASWIADTIGCSVYDFRSSNISMLSEYNTIIYGGSITVGKIAGIKSILTLPPHPGQKLLFFAVGASKEEPQTVDTLRSANLPSDCTAPLFYFRGGIDPSKHSFPLKLVARLLKKELDKTEMAGSPVSDIADYTDKTAINKLLNAL